MFQPGQFAGLPERDERRALLWMPDFVVARENSAATSA
jgi:hypothetical protein